MGIKRVTVFEHVMYFYHLSRREDFELGPLLGRGSYACVYEARSRHTGQRVALKVSSQNGRSEASTR